MLFSMKIYNQISTLKKKVGCRINQTQSESAIFNEHEKGVSAFSYKKLRGFIFSYF